MKIESGKKIDFIKEVFETCEMTQTYIFVNTKNFAERLHNTLRKAGLGSNIMFSKMSKEERDETMQKFRDQNINVLICTDLVSRGVDVPEAELVINFDVPTQNVKGKPIADVQTYLHRIGRAGRFGRKAVALTIWDRDVDKGYLDDIMNFYGFDDKTITGLQGADHLKEILREISDS